MTTVYARPLRFFEPRGRPLMDVHPMDDGTDDDNLTSSILSNEPKLMTKAVAQSTNQSRSSELWTIREVENGEEELYARERCAYLTRNSLIIKSFNFTEQVTKVFWSKFNNINHVCIILTSGLSIFNPAGQHFQVPLPFAFQNVYPSSSGLVIERNCDFLEESKFPTLFSLTQPTREVTPILFKHPTRHNGDERAVYAASLPSFMSIVACHNDIPLCLVYNSQDCQHSIWRIRPVADNEIDEFQRASHDESTINTTTMQHSYREGNSQHSLSLSSKQRSSLAQNTHSSPGTMNFSPKMDLRSKHSTMGNLAASRLGIGTLPAHQSNQTVGEGISTHIESYSSLSAKNLLSTPNRNQLINYLRDTIEEPILPELTYEQLWVGPSNSTVIANKFFSTSDFFYNNYLVIVTSAATQIKLIKCENLSDLSNSLSFGRTHFITAIDALPIPKMMMMIVIDSNKEFSLYSGLDRITQVLAPHSPTASLRMPSTSSPAFKHPESTPYHQASSARKRGSASDRHSVSSDLSIHQMFQALSPVPHPSRHEQKFPSTPANSGDIRRLEYVVGRSVLVACSNNQRARFEVPSICQTESLSKLIKAMTSLVPKDLAISLISRWYTFRRSSFEHDLMPAREELKLFKNWILTSIGVTSNYFEDNVNPKNIELSVKLVTLSPNKKSRRSREIETNPVVENIYSIFYAIHLVFEDLLLNKIIYDRAYDLAELLIVLSCILKLKHYQDYYWLKFPRIQEKFGSQKTPLGNLIPKVELLRKPVYFSQQPPSVMDFVNEIISQARLGPDFTGRDLAPYPRIADVTEDSYIVISLFCEMFNINRSQAVTPISMSTTTYPSPAPFKQPHRSREADQHLVELMVSLGKTRDYLLKLPEGLNLYLWDAILNCRESPPATWTGQCYDLVGRMDLVELANDRIKKKTDDDRDDEDFINLIFPDDIRVLESRRMLLSNIPVEFSVTQRPGATDDESRDEIQRHLFLLNVRTMAMSIGRGAINLRTYSPVIGESFEVPRLELSGRALSEERTIEYAHDISVYPWPYFHNGVAAGLTICASTASDIIDSTWINYNRPRSNMPNQPEMRDRDFTNINTTNEHAGFLFALGLNGHLEKLSIMALHDYLCQNSDLTKLAILLGMSAAKRGSRDNHMIKVLSIHVDALLPPNSTELDVSASVHAASIIGVGLLYQSSGDSHISKVLLEEIGRLPGPEANSHVDRESYSLSAGLAFGLVNLCKGGSSTISSSDQLRLYMLGGRRKPLTLTQKERYFKQDCHRGEEENINTHITSPGGTLGLGLMYHRSGNQSVANWMRAPDTQTGLESVRPDFLILRMLSYGLIMWDEITPSERWVDSHIPTIVSLNAFQRSPQATTSNVMSLFSRPRNASIDFELMSQAYCNIVAGCCMAIAMRYAGTANRDAYRTIYKHTKMLIALSCKPSLVEQAGRPCTEACLNVLVTSLAVVMAGTGDLGTMRVCRYLRSRLTQSCVFYGAYMATHMALGILFLGSCRYSLSTSPEAIGALVCALYPIYPNHSSDNRYHLQALRHLYVLAVEPRLLIPRDIVSNKSVYAFVTVRQRLDDGSTVELKLKAPCLMPEVSSILSICVDDKRYWAIEINSREALVKCLSRNQGCLSVKPKAHSSNNDLVKNIEKYILGQLEVGKMKSQKSAALSECVKEDRVEQYSSLDNLFAKTRTKKVDEKLQLLILEQLHLACTLNYDQTKIMNKIHLLKSVASECEAEITSNCKKISEEWLNFVSGRTNWTSTNECVAKYIVLNHLKCYDVNDEFLRDLKQLAI